MTEDREAQRSPDDQGAGHSAIAPRSGIVTQAFRNPWLAWILAAAIFVSLAFWRINPKDLATAFVDVRYQWLAAVLLLYLAARVLAAWEWQVLLTKVGRAPIAGLFGATLIGTFANAVLPANLGEVAKLQLVANRYSLPRAGLVAGRGSEAVVNAMMFVLFALVSITLVRGGISSQNQNLWWLLAAATALASVAAVIASRAVPNSAPRWRVVERLPRPLHDIVIHQWPRFHDGFEVIRRPRLLALLLLVNFAGWGIDLIITWSYGNAFSLNLPFSAYLSVTLALAIITTVPITFGNIGTWELGIVGVLALYDVPPDRALAYAVGSHVVITGFNIGMGLLAMGVMGVRLRDVFQLRGAGSLNVQARGEHREPRRRRAAEGGP